MHANVHGPSGGGKSWHVPPDETLQIGGDKKGGDNDQDLYGSDGHNWRSIVFSLLVIGLVITGIVIAIYLLGYVDELLYWSGKRMTFDEYLQDDFTPKRLPSSWVTNTKFVFQSDDGSLAILDTANDSVTTLVTNHTMRQLNVKGYQCSSDLRYVLFTHNVKYIFKNSYNALFTVYDVTNDHHMPVRLKDSLKQHRMQMQHAEWLGNSTTLVIVHENDIYIRQSPSDEEDIRLTNTGVSGIIYNGVTDWLYQEEILKSQKALWSSNDGFLLVYATFNDTNVGQMVYPWFSSNPLLQSGGLTSKGSFPDAQNIRYPTPGTFNPEVTLWLLDLHNITDVQKYQLKEPISLEGQDSYLISASYLPTQTATGVSIVWMSRPQNYSVVSTCLAPNWACVETHSERAPEDEWLDMLPHPVFSPDGDSFMLLAGIQESSTEHFTHIKHVTITQQRISVISHGRYENRQAVVTNGIHHQVLRILAWDTKNHLVYYLGTQDKKPGQQHLYIVKDPVNEDPRSSLDRKITRTEPICITCDLGEILWRSRYYYGNCSHFDAYVSPQSSISSDSGVEYYILECRGPSLPLAGVHSAKTHKLVRILYDTRTRYLEKLQELALPIQKSFEISLTHGTRAAVQMFLPPSWREELRDAAYPVLVEVNGRPGEATVVDEFRMDWGTYMSSHNDIVYIRLDVRGAKGQGKKKLFRHLGGVEVDDRIAAVEYLLNKMKFLDKTRVGVWGWGFGGYVTAMVLGSSNKRVFKCGIAVSPITDWIYYNSAFTERIMGLPIENYKAYVEADATQRAKNIPSDAFFLIHGMADATTPYHHSVQLARGLTNAGTIFRYTSYADEGHDLRGVTEHVYRSMEHYYKSCLSLDSDVDEPIEEPVPSEPIKFFKYFFRDKNKPKTNIMD